MKMPVAVEREELIKQHLKIKGELEDIKAEIDKLEKANEYLRRQNQSMRQMMEAKQNTEETATTNKSANGAKNQADEGPQAMLSSFGLPGTGFIMDTISQATAFGDAATGEIFKQARSMADDFAKRLQLTEEPSQMYGSDNILQKLVRRTSAPEAVGSSLSREESVAESCVDGTDNSEKSEV